MSERVFVRTRSHRARHTLKRITADDCQPYFSFHDGSGFYSIPAHLLAEARAIKGITLARPTHELMRCWP